jgi:hypothetical protein
VNCEWGLEVFQCLGLAISSGSLTLNPQTLFVLFVPGSDITLILLFQQVNRVCSSVQAILVREALYNAAGLCCYELQAKTVFLEQGTIDL